jgi:hypothetical protein
MPYPAPQKVSKVFSKEEYADLCSMIHSKIKIIDDKLDTFRTETLPEYVRLYKGLPKEKEANFPWPGAANLVVQLIGTFSDELLSRVMGGIFQYDPLFPVVLSGDSPEHEGEEMKRALERFLMDESYDPDALDMYRVENAFFSSAIRYGTGAVSFPWEYDVQREYVYVGGGTTEKDPVRHTFKDTVRRDSPHPEIIPLNKFGIDPRTSCLGNADFFYHIETLDYWSLSNLPGKDSLVDEEDIQKIKNSPDRTTQDEMQSVTAEELGISTSSTYKGSAEWDICKCYITYQKGNETYSLLAKYHKKSRTVLYVIFNFYPGNDFPVEDVKLAYDEENYFGYGYAQMLRSYQKELSQNSNWRTNNRNMAMMQLLRVDPQSKLSSVLQVFPGCMIPAKDGEVEVLKSGADVGYSSEADQFIMACAKERAGVDPAIGGTGGGIVNNKRGIYSASGTSMMLIQQNNRNNLRMSDMRSAHIRIAKKLMGMYSNFGIGPKLKKYGDSADSLRKALDAYKNETLGFRLRPASASNNKELERQNDILLSNSLAGFYERSAQMIQAAIQPNCPPELKAFYEETLLASQALMKSVLRNFNHDDVMRLLPKPPQFTPTQGAGDGQSGGAGQQALGNQGAIPGGGIQGSGGIPQIPPG